MNKGTVKWFNNKRGYGFITGENGEDIFVHYTGIVSEGFKKLQEGQSVTYDIVENEEKHMPQATNVVVC